jgi:hypothetical protein
MKMIGNIFTSQYPECWIADVKVREGGRYEIAYTVNTPDGKTGLALFTYEFYKRDVMYEEVRTTPDIADDMQKFLSDRSPCCFEQFAFPKGEENTNSDAVEETRKKVTVTVYGENI